MGTWLHIASLANLPTLGIVIYIAFASGQLSQRVHTLEKRATRIEDLVFHWLENNMEE